jgi:hypothetical protein
MDQIKLPEVVTLTLRYPENLRKGGFAEKAQPQ